MSSKSYSHFFSKKFPHICVSLDVNFNESLTNDVVSFEQLGPGLQHHALFAIIHSREKYFLIIVFTVITIIIIIIYLFIYFFIWCKSIHYFVAMKTIWGTLANVYSLHVLAIAQDKIFLYPYVTFFLFFLQNLCCAYSLEAHYRGASNEYPQHMIDGEKRKNI